VSISELRGAAIGVPLLLLTPAAIAANMMQYRLVW
jgi:hypothetical protein